MKNNYTLEQIENFLTCVDCDFPMPLHEKVNLSSFSLKLYKNADIFVEIDNDEIIGMVAGYIKNAEDNVSYISIVAIKRDYRGKSIATKLLKEYFHECKLLNINKIHLYTSKTNINAILLYKKIGFIESIDINRPDDIHFILNR